MGNKPNDSNSQDVYSQNNFQDINIKESLNRIKTLSESLNKPLSESVFELTNCFICYNSAIDPISCPKCNNFACRKCFERYFENKTVIPCPFCKQQIRFNQLVKKTIIEEIESILNRNQNNKEKIEELNKLAEEKKKYWDEQTFSVNKFMDRINEYKRIFVRHLNEEEIFFKNCLKVLTNILNNFNENIDKLIESLLSYNKAYGNSNKEFEEFKSEKNNYNNEIKEKIKEILSLERKHFNEKQKEDCDKFLRNPKFCVPHLFSIKLAPIQLEKYNTDIIKEKVVNSRNSNLGNYEFKFIQNVINKDVNCYFNFNSDEDIDISAFIKLIKKENEGYNKNFSMKFIKKEGKKYFYEYTISFKEFKEGINKSFNLFPEIKLFGI